MQSAQVTLQSLNVKPMFQLDSAERDALIHTKNEQDNIYTSPDNNENTKLISHENQELKSLQKVKYGKTQRKLEKVVYE